MSVTEAGGDLVNAVCGTHSFLPLSAPGCVPEESLLSSYYSLKFHIHSGEDVCGGHAREHPKGRPVSGACRGRQLSPVTETWVLSIRARPLLLDSCLFLQSPITHTAPGDPSLTLTEATAFVVWVQVALVPGMSLQIVSQQLHKAVSPNCVCLPDGISFSSLLLPLPAHLCGRKDRLMGIVLVWCHHAGIRSRTFCV